jgi:competence protein ComEC
MKLLNTSFLWLFSAFVAGIFLGHNFTSNFDFAFSLLIASLSSWLIVFLFQKKSWLPLRFFSITSLITFLVIGFFCVQLQMHYLYQEIKTQPNQLLHLKLKQELKGSTSYSNYIAQIKNPTDFRQNNLVLLRVYLKDSAVNYQPGDAIITKTNLAPLKEPLFPEQFNYKQYLSNKHVTRETRVASNEIIHHKNSNPTWLDQSEVIKKKITHQLKKTKLKPRHIAFINALVLGNKNLLERSTYQQFQKAGVVHILAVSGLHVGLIVLLLQGITYFLKHKKWTRSLRVLLIVNVLWLYAWLVGFSPSITRAVTMFSFFILLTLINRKTNGITSLALSAMLLLFIDPWLVFDVGFQLSYFAVASILFFYPIIYNLFSTKTWLIRKAWALASVTLSAQIGVLPFTLYYFNQIPGLFLISNLLILPFLFLVLLSCIISILGSFYFIELEWIQGLTEHIIDGLMWVIEFIARQDAYYFDHVYFSESMLALCVFSFFSLIGFFYSSQKRIFGLFALSALIATQLVYIIDYQNAKQIRKAMILPYYKTSTLAIHNPNAMLIYSDSTVSTKVLDNYKTKYFINDIQQNKRLNRALEIDGISVLRIDSDLYAEPSKTPVDVLWLSHSPRINLERVIRLVQPKTIVADQSNYKSYVTRWQSTALKEKIPFFDSAKKGTFYIMSKP